MVFALGRWGANTLYLMVVSLIAYIFFVSKYDPAYPTGSYVEARVISIRPKPSRISAKKIVRFRTNQGIEIVEVLGIGYPIKNGQVVHFEVLKTPKRGLVKYKMAP